jgi:MoaA/NifB/PqqE/SkfB family radical SAM enzyme
MTKFCNLLSNQFFIHYDNIKPCCVFDKEFPINSTSIDFFRELANKKTWSDHCFYCKNLEDKNQESPRQVSLKDRHNVFDIHDKIGVPKIIEIQIDRDCNAACIMCDSAYSTTWEQYSNKHAGINYIPKNISIKTRLENISKNLDLSELKHVRILGGEPFKNNNHLEILKLIPNLNNLIVTYTTNGSFIPNQDSIEIWKKLKNVDINISIDGIDNHYEYIRWPLKWSTLLKTLDFFANTDLKNLYIGTSYTVNPLNLYYTDIYKNWIEKYFAGSNIWYANTFFNDGFASYGIINLNCIPPKFKDAIGLKFGKDHRLYNLIGDFDLQAHYNFITYLNKHDEIRKLNWANTFPEISDLLTYNDHN